MAPDKQHDLDKENLIDNGVISYRLRNLTAAFLSHEGRKNISAEAVASFKKRGRRNGALQTIASHKSNKRQRFAESLLENRDEIPVGKDSAAFYDDNTTDYGMHERKKAMGERYNTRNCASFAEKCHNTSINSTSERSAKNLKKSSVISKKEVAETDSRAAFLQSDSLVVSLSPVKYIHGQNEEFVGSVSKRLDRVKSADTSDPSIVSSLRHAIEANVDRSAEVVANGCTNSCRQDLAMASKDFVMNKFVDVCELDKDSEATTAGRDISKARVGQKCAKVDNSDDEEEPDISFGYEDGMYEVEHIVAKRICKKSGRCEYYIKWVGWPYRTCTWETASQFGEMREAKSQFNIREHALKVVMERPDRCVQKRHLRQLHSLTRWENSINAILRGEGREILYIYNDVDGECSRPNFNYITRNKYSPELEHFLRKVKRSNACKCGPNCGSGAECCPAREHTNFFYTKRGAIKVDFYTSAKSEKSEMIVECSDECQCDDSCPTKVVQRGRRYKVAIVRRKKCGWGVVALEDISSNSFVVEYVGEVLTVEEAASRKDNTYHFELDGSGVTKYVIDAKYYGNEAAFINHSCDPNLDAICVQIERADPSLHRIALFSNRRIARGEELTLNYFCGQDYEEHGSGKKKSSKGRQCFCGAANCMKYWPTSGADSGSEESDL
uniref:Histone-lysine N-methyltransferase SUV39H2 n=1 Tax=Ascaris suum TaxID=6253 RepID=F1KWE6_ASCSU